MFTGADLRVYRSRLGLSQEEFAVRMGRSQAVLSQLEAGKTKLTEKHIQSLTEKFNAANLSVRFSDFAAEVEAQKAHGQAALSVPGSQYLVLKVWPWNRDFDLGHAPTTEGVDWVLIRAPRNPAIALAMNKTTSHYAEGETLVFEKISRDDVRDGDLLMVQATPPKSQSPRTLLVRARVTKPARGHVVQLEAIDPPGTLTFEGDDENVLSWLRLVHRARYV